MDRYEYTEVDKEDTAMLASSDGCAKCIHAAARQQPTLKSRLRTGAWLVLGPFLVTVATFTVLLHLPIAARLSLSQGTCDLNTRHLGFLPSADILRVDDFQPTADAWITSPYSGPPTEANGLAWNDLQRVRGARVSKAEGKMINLPDGLKLENGDHPTITGVMHNLHCLRMIRQYLYSDYYYPNVSDSKMEYYKKHADHCIETLRESTTCIPDLTPHALYWVDEEERIHVNLKSVVKRQCVNWESLVSWQRKREYNLDDLWVANPATKRS